MGDGDDTCCHKLHNSNAEMLVSHCVDGNFGLREYVQDLLPRTIDLKINRFLDSKYSCLFFEAIKYPLVVFISNCANKPELSILGESRQETFPHPQLHGMVFLGAELSKRNHQIGSWLQKIGHRLHYVVGIYGWVYDLGDLRPPPQFEDVVIGPCAVRGDLVSSDLPAEFVYIEEHVLVNPLHPAHQLAPCYLLPIVILSLPRGHILHHVVADQWVMRVGVQLRPKEEFHERIGITDTHGVYENVARAEHQGFEDNCYRSKSLPKHSEARIILRF